MVDRLRIPLLLAIQAATIITVASLMTGCSGRTTESSTQSEATIASVRTQTQKATTETSPDDARPLLRPDASKEEWQRLYRAYYDCLVQHGIPRTVDGGPLGKVAYDETKPRDKNALKACHQTDPETYENREKRQNFAAYSDHN